MARILIRQAHGGQTRIISDPALPYFLNQGWVVLDTIDDATDASPVYLSAAESDLRYATITDLGDPESAEVVVISETVADILVDPATGPGGDLRAAFVAAVVVTGAGIDSTGAADSSAALQALLDDMPDGGTVHFPAGTYLLGGVELPPHTKVTFDRGATIKVKAGVNAFTATGTAGASITLADTADHQTHVQAASGTPFVVGQILFIEGTPTNSGSAAPFPSTTFPGQTSQMRRVIAVASAGARALLDGPVYVHQTAPTAQVVTPVRDVTIDGARVVAEGPTSKGLVNATYTDAVAVRNCLFEQVGGNNSGGVSIVVSLGATVEDNTFDRSPYAAVFTYKSTGTKVRGNTIIGATAPFSFLARFLNAVEHEVSGNRCTRSRFVAATAGDDISGLFFESDTDAPSTLANIVRGNTVHNGGFGTTPGNGRAAIHMIFAAYNLVTGNQTSGGDIGVYLSSYAARNRVTDNRCNRHHGYYGVGIELDLYVQQNTVSGNDCSNNGATLPLDPGSTVSTLDSQTTTEGHGIEFRTNHFQSTVQGNTCVGNAGSGIAFIGAGGSGVVGGNTALGNSGSGVLIDGASNGYQIVGNDLEYNTVAAVTSAGGAFGVTQANNLT